MAYNLFVAFHAARDASRAHTILDIWQKIDEIKPCGLGTSDKGGKGTNRGGNEFDDLLTRELGRTNCVVVLIGYQTAKQPWILQTLKKGFQFEMGPAKPLCDRSSPDLFRFLHTVLPGAGAASRSTLTEKVTAP